MTIGTVMLLECLDSKAPCPFITCVIWFIASMLWISTNVSSCVNIRVIKITTYSTGVRISLHMYIITGPTEADMRYLWRDKIPTDFFCILSLYVDNCVIANCGYKSVTVNYDALFLNLNNNLLLYIYIKKTLCHVQYWPSHSSSILWSEAMLRDTGMQGNKQSWLRLLESNYTCNRNGKTTLHFVGGDQKRETWYRWLSKSLRELQCVSNWVIAVLHKAIDIKGWPLT